jgi:hypothetical protein
MSTLAVLAIIASALTGYWLYKNYQGGGDAIYDAVATVSSVLWVLAGLFAIAGGMVLIGSVLIAVFTYVGLSKGSKTTERARARIAG